MPGPFQNPGDLRATFLRGQEGGSNHDPNERVDSLVNASPQARQTITATLSNWTATPPRTYTLGINGSTLTYTTIPADLDEAGAAAGLAGVLESDPAVGGVFNISQSGAVITLVNLQFGSDASVSGGPDVAVAQTQAGATAARIPAGRVVLMNAIESASHQGRQGQLAQASAFAAQVDTLTGAGITAGITSVLIYKGASYSVSVDFNADNDATMGDLRTALTALVASNALPLVIGGATDTVTVTASQAGDSFSSQVGGDVGLTVASTRGLGTSLEDAVGGIAKIPPYQAEYVGDGSAISWPANAGVHVYQKHIAIWCLDAAGENPAIGSPVYVDLNAGADAGRIRYGAAAGRVLLPYAKVRSGADADGLVKISLDLPLR